MPSNMEFFTFPRLKSARKEQDSNHMDYKSGATFSGQLDGRKREGHGVFVWPSGDRYTGDYVNNDRFGKGEQLWSDGSRFTGDFVRDTRHGNGEHVWSNGETFKGSYFKDHRHGKGTYTWPNKSKFVGTFYKNRKEGYGVFEFSKGNKFQGLYINDEREGPGVLSYQDGTHDVGLWRKERLVKLCSCIDGAFTMASHKDFDYNPTEHVLSLPMVDPRYTSLSQMLKMSRSEGQSEADSSLRNAMERLAQINFKTTFDVFQSSTPDSVDMNTLTYDKEEYDRAFFGEAVKGDNNSQNSQQTLVALNNTPSLIEMQLNVMKHKNTENTMGFSVDDLMKGDRGAFLEKGPIEVMSEELIKASAAGDYTTVHCLLSQGAVNVNVGDKNGHISLIGAAVNMHRDIINCLLDNGADVNKLNDEGLSALAACHVLFYPIASFQFNIAERYLPVPRGEERIELQLPTEGSPDDASEEGCPNGSSPAKHPDDGSERSSRAGERARSVIGDDGDFYDVDTNSHRDENQDAGTLDGTIPEWDPDNESVEERVSVKKQGSLGHRRLSSKLYGVSSEVADTHDFETNDSLVGVGVKVTEDMIERCATVMSNNPRIVSRGISQQEDNLDEARRRALAKAEHANMEATIRLLLRRGADPNASSVPMPVLFFAIKAADVEAVSILLEKGAATEARLSPDKEGLNPLHISCAIRGPEGVEITKLLLNAGAHPNSRALDKDLHEHLEDLTPLDPSIKLKPGLDGTVFHYLQELEAKGDHSGGRTPLHIACDRDDDYELARQVVHLLLEHGANPNVLCKGQSPLSLAIASGNDLAIDELLSFDANPSLPLGQAIGSALCVTANTQFEFRRMPLQRIALIDKLVEAGANILAPIAVGTKRQMGTAVDYAYWMFNQDRRIAHMPYHALTHAERDTYNARRKLLSHLGEILREAAVRRERERLDKEDREGIRSLSPSQGFLYTGAGANASDTSMANAKNSSKVLLSGGVAEGSKQVAFHTTIKDSTGAVQPLVDRDEEVAVSGEGAVLMVVDMAEGSMDASHSQRLIKHASRSHIRKPLFRYCYECGRSIGVRLSACTRCKEVYYCSKACKIKAWNARHKEECLRLGGRSRSPSPTNPAAGGGYNAAYSLQNNTGGRGQGPHGKVKGEESTSKMKTVVGSSVRGQTGARGQQGAGFGNSKGGLGFGKAGAAGKSGQSPGDKGSKAKGQGQQGGGGGDGRTVTGFLNSHVNSGGRDGLTGVKADCTENYSFV
ncbi:ankyrin repeat and MYND domain-containing protein 1-like [Diadema antillarum]|uniref:ankyrin repeat and MYND domain-containing protein 1-like n=1 Tax=Diadema antillarum TaxID=105358 RepID=UPI003A849494